MKTIDKIIWLKGYLESLYLSENVTKEHIKLLISKFEDLSEEVEIMASLIDDENTSPSAYSSDDHSNTGNTSSDDLPF